MPYDLVVYLTRSALPEPAVWHASILESGFPVRLSIDFDVDAFRGFLPCPVDGEASGFGYRASAVSQEEAQELGLGSGTNYAVQFSIGHRPLEKVSALAASSVLAALSGGILDDPQSGESIAGASAIGWARARLARPGL